MDETYMVSDHEGRESNRHDATLAYINRRALRDLKIEDEKAESDPDYDFHEFGDADVEEAEDRIYSEYKHAQRQGQVLGEDALSRLAGNVPLEDMDQSIVMSARNGLFTSRNQLNLKKDVSHSLLDLS